MCAGMGPGVCTGEGPGVCTGEGPGVCNGEGPGVCAGVGSEVCTYVRTYVDVILQIFECAYPCMCICICAQVFLHTCTHSHVCLQPTHYALCVCTGVVCVHGEHCSLSVHGFHGDEE